MKVREYLLCGPLLCEETRPELRGWWRSLLISHCQPVRAGGSGCECPRSHQCIWGPAMR